MIASWVYEQGFADLEGSIAGIRRRIDRGRAREGDLEALDELEVSLRELRAYYRADRRIELELLVDGIHDSLAVALIQAEELLVDDLTLRTIPAEARERLRLEREADFAVILYDLADDRGSTSRR